MPTDDGAPSVASKIIRVARHAGSPSEDTYDRDGGFSYHAESHAFGVGFGLGILAAQSGEYRYVGAIVAALFGLDRGPTLQSPKVVEDIKQEPHYFLIGAGLGIALGTAL